MFKIKKLTNQKDKIRKMKCGIFSYFCFHLSDFTSLLIENILNHIGSHF